MKIAWKLWAEVKNERSYKQSSSLVYQRYGRCTGFHIYGVYNSPTCWEVIGTRIPQAIPSIYSHLRGRQYPRVISYMYMYKCNTLRKHLVQSRQLHPRTTIIKLSLWIPWNFILQLETYNSTKTFNFHHLELVLVGLEANHMVVAMWFVYKQLHVLISVINKYFV